MELARTLTTRRYLDGGSETEDVAALLVEVAGSLSMHTSVRFSLIQYSCSIGADSYSYLLVSVDGKICLLSHLHDSMSGC